MPITPALRETLGLEPIEGRSFTASEAEQPLADVVVVNKRLADVLWPGESAMGRRLQVIATDCTNGYRVIGVVPDVVYEELGEETSQSRLIVYAPYARVGWRTMAMLVRTQMNPAAITADARGAVRRVDPSFAAFDVLTMTDRRMVTTGRALSRPNIRGVRSCRGSARVSRHLRSHRLFRRTADTGDRRSPGHRRSAVRHRPVASCTRSQTGCDWSPRRPSARRCRSTHDEGLLFRVSPWEVPVWTSFLSYSSRACCWQSACRRASLTDPVTALRGDSTLGGGGWALEGGGWGWCLGETWFVRRILPNAQKARIKSRRIRRFRLVLEHEVRSSGPVSGTFSPL